MKRIYACIWIAVAVLLLAFWGAAIINRFSDTMNAQLDSVQAAAEAEDSARALQETGCCLVQFRDREKLLSLFLRRDYLAALDVTLSAMAQYTAEENWDEALAECSRARSQKETMVQLFFRML